MPRYLKPSELVEARQFETNNEVESPHMDSIVNWLNQGRGRMCAWHNGTDIFVVLPSGMEWRAYVGDYIVRDGRGDLSVWDKDNFERVFELDGKKVEK